MAVTTVQIRLLADTAEEAAAAIAALRSAVGSARVALSGPRTGRKGGYLAYGTLQIETMAPGAPLCPHCGQAHDITTRIHGDRVWCHLSDAWFTVVLRPGGAAELIPCAAPVATGPEGRLTPPSRPRRRR